MSKTVFSARQYNRLKNELATLTEELNSTNAKLGRARKTNSALRVRNKELGAEKKALQDQVDELTDLDFEKAVLHWKMEAAKAYGYVTWFIKEVRERFHSSNTPVPSYIPSSLTDALSKLPPNAYSIPSLRPLSIPVPPPKRGGR